MNFNLKELILRATQYVSGYKNTEDKYVISASMLGNDTLQNYLSLIHGKQANKSIDDTTLGSVFHTGMETIVKNRINSDEPDTHFLFPEEALNMELPNGWMMSGTADLMTQEMDRPNFIVVRDYKLSKMYALKKLKPKIKTHQYTKQLQALRAMILSVNPDAIIELKLDFFAKDAKALEFEETYTEVDIPVPTEYGERMMSDNTTNVLTANEWFIQDVVEQTDILQSYIESGTIPPQCEDVWIRNVKGKVIPTRCAVWCSFGDAGLCPHYDNKSRTTVNRIAGWDGT